MLTNELLEDLYNQLNSPIDCGMGNNSLSRCMYALTMVSYISYVNGELEKIKKISETTLDYDTIIIDFEKFLDESYWTNTYLIKYNFLLYHDPSFDDIKRFSELFQCNHEECSYGNFSPSSFNDAIQQICRDDNLGICHIQCALHIGINNLLSLLTKIKENIEHPQEHLFADFWDKFYYQFQEDYDEEILEKYNKWKKDLGQSPDLQRLRDRQMQELVKLLTSDFLQFRPIPTKREVEKCKIVIDKGALEIDCILPDNIVTQCAKFEYFASWADKNNTMLVLNSERLGKYLHEYLPKMEDDGKAILEYALRTYAIHKDMAELNPSLSTYLAHYKEGGGAGMSDVRQSKLNDIIGISKRGNWKHPATADNVEQLLNVVFGKDTSLLDEGDVEYCEKMWALVEKSRGKDRKVIVSAKLAGFMGREENLMKNDGPKAISDDLFGKNNNQVNAINKGKKGCSKDFDAVIPFLKKYIDRIIRQV